jgi:arylsulfatase A-like enzyme
MLGDHGLLGKGGFRAEGQHIPLIVKLPGGAAGKVAAFTSAADVFPTLLDLWGIDGLHAPDGTSLRPALEGTGAAGRDWALWEFDFRHALTHSARAGLGIDDLRACHLTVLRRADAQYVHMPALPPLLFDLSADPEARIDAATRRPDLRLAMAEALLSRLTCLKDETLAPLKLPLA